MRGAENQYLARIYRHFLTGLRVAADALALGSRTKKLPKEEIFTFSPRARASAISFRTTSTRSADSFRDRPTS